VAWSTGEEFDASWNRGSTLDFPVGVGMVIQGWDQGLLGMKVGGRRRLEIPSELAYGAAGAPGAIGPNEALIFVVDLMGIK
ncbi:FKBP-type peptidyl-prolyl cis-trans isomerase, partial [Acinetobacter baumannii]